MWVGSDARPHGEQVAVFMANVGPINFGQCYVAQNAIGDPFLSHSHHFHGLDQ